MNISLSPLLEVKAALVRKAGTSDSMREIQAAFGRKMDVHCQPGSKPTEADSSNSL